MSRVKGLRKCKHCGDFFSPDPRNRHHQQFCSKPQCKKASKAQSQRRWLKKPENRNYFRGSDNVKRVQQWRKEHPGYWRKASSQNNALQEILSENDKRKQKVKYDFAETALQDLLPMQSDVFIGLIANLTGTALQDDIAITLGRMQQLGRDILNHKGGGYVQEVPHLSGQSPASPETVQLGGPALGPG